MNEEDIEDFWGQLTQPDWRRRVLLQKAALGMEQVAWKNGRDLGRSLEDMLSNCCSVQMKACGERQGRHNPGRGTNSCLLSKPNFHNASNGIDLTPEVSSSLAFCLLRTPVCSAGLEKRNSTSTSSCSTLC
jgi:hypothetical protein